MSLFAGYVRVSRVGDRSDTLISPQLQKEAITRWADANGHQVVMLPPELDASGGDDDRPVLLGAIERVERGELDGIVVWRFDRFTRSLASSLRMLERVEGAGGALRSTSEELDASTPSGRMVRNFMFSLAQAEREQRAEGFEAAKAAAVARGVHISGWVPLGYAKDEDRRLVPDPATAPAVKLAFEMRAAGASWRRIADALAEELGRPMHAPTVSRMVRNRVYLGEARQGRHANPDAHEPLVDRSLWEAAQLDMPRSPRGVREVALLAGLVRCAGCSRRMSATFTAAKGRREYRCRVHGAGGKCPKPAFITGSIVEPLVEAAVLRHVEDQSVTARQRGRALADAERALSEASAELVAYQEATAALSDPDAFAHGLRTRHAAVEEARVALARAQGGSARAPAPETVRGVWPTLTNAEKNRVLRGALGTIWIKKGRGAPASRVRLVAAGFEPAGLSDRGTRFVPIAAPWPDSDLPGEIRVPAA